MHLMDNGHKPVLLREMIEALQPSSGKTYVDATFGGGGYSEAILKAADCKVIAIDRDPDAIERSSNLSKNFPNNFTIVQGCFGNITQLLNSINIDKIDGIVFDFGVSSYQIDQAERGFSFRFDGPLDMRMSNEGISAADVINTFTQEQIESIIKTYGEEKKSRAIAKAVVESRRNAPITTTLQLAELIRGIVKKKDGLDPATLTFQGLRIYVNNELLEIENTLKSCVDLLGSQGRLVAVTFHALEDRLVKNFLRQSQGTSISRYTPDLPGNQTDAPSPFKTLFSKAITPTRSEIRSNPRSRSARLRAAVRVRAGEEA